MKCYVRWRCRKNHVRRMVRKDLPDQVTSLLSPKDKTELAGNAGGRNILKEVRVSVKSVWPRFLRNTCSIMCHMWQEQSEQQEA